MAMGKGQTLESLKSIIQDKGARGKGSAGAGAGPATPALANSATLLPVSH